MQCMVTITHNDHVPELLAVIRRKPFAEPTETEMVEYLFTRVRTDRRKADFENFAFEHVLSYQRRIAATKEHFMRRNKLTPLGIMQDWWAPRRVIGILVTAGLVFSLLSPFPISRIGPRLKCAPLFTTAGGIRYNYPAPLPPFVNRWGVAFCPSRGAYSMLVPPAAVPERL